MPARHFNMRTMRVQVGPTTFGTVWRPSSTVQIRTTEDGQTRTTEDGQTRTLEAA